MAACPNLSTTNTTTTNPPTVADKATQTEPSTPPPNANPLLFLLSLLATPTPPSNTHAPTTLHPSVPNPLFTPPASPTTTITIDASTRIIGHCNTLHLSAPPSSQSIDALLTTTLRNLPSSPRTTAPPSPFGNGWGGLPTPLGGWAPSPRFDIKVNAGVNVCGSRNLVVVGGNGKVVGGVKRKAEVDLDDVPVAKKVVKKEK